MRSPESIAGVAEAVAAISVALADGERSRRFERLFPALPAGAAGGVGTAPLRVSNLVLQGGGMLGAAHVGFIYALESAGLRFAAVAGASAGSIVAIGLVCSRGQDMSKPTGEDLFDLVSSVPTDIFIDGPPRVRRLLKRFLRGSKVFVPAQAVNLRYAWRQLLGRRGLNPGDQFETWLAMTLARKFGIETLDDLDDCLAVIRAQLGFLVPSGTDPEHDLLKLMATAVPIGLKFEFPRALTYLDARHRTGGPALLVRCSMSIPAFFEPVELRTDPLEWRDFITKSYPTLAEGGELGDLAALEHVYMLDGGVFSNLPLDAFAHMAHLPTIAVALVSQPPALRPAGQATLKGLAEDLLGLVTAMKAQRDRDALTSLERNRPADFRRLRLVGIGTGHHNWLNFMAGQEDLDDLFVRGVVAARNFVEGL